MLNANLLYPFKASPAFAGKVTVIEGTIDRRKLKTVALATKSLLDAAAKTDEYRAIEHDRCTLSAKIRERKADTTLTPTSGAIKFRTAPAKLQVQIRYPDFYTKFPGPLNNQAKDAVEALSQKVFSLFKNHAGLINAGFIPNSNAAGRCETAR